MDLDLSGRTALITGSTAGIGRAIAAELAQAGAAIVVHGRDRSTVDPAVEELGAHAGVTGDLATPEGLDAIRSWASTHEVDILVNSAGPFTEHTYLTAQPDDWLDAYRTNVVAAVDLATTVLPRMRATGFGRVIFIGTRGTRTPIPTMIEYSAAKAALANASISLARSAAGPGVTVNMVSPGIVLTPGVRDMFTSRPEYAGKAWQEIETAVSEDYAPNPIGRLGRPDDIAAVVAFLSTPAAGYVNGADIPVDGGITGTH